MRHSFRATRSGAAGSAALLALALACAPTSDGLLAPSAHPTASAAPFAAAARAAALPAVRISEFHYDNAGADAGERIEISGPAGTDVTGWQLLLYNGNGGATYLPTGATAPITLSGTIPATCGERGVLVVDALGLQNGAPDGLALVDAGGTVREFLSYEGSFVATNGAASGMTATDVGVSQGGSEPLGASLQRRGDGSWVATTTNTFGACNDAAEEPPATVVRVAVTPATATLAQGATRQFTAVAYDAADVVVPGAPISWSVEPSTVATTNASGLVTALQVGTAQVVATSGGVRGTAALTVTTGSEGPVGDVRVSEFHYDNSGADVGERVELEGNAGVSLAGWRLVLYSVGSGATQGLVYGTVELSGTFGTACSATRGVLTVDVPGLQNGPTDGFALVDPSDRVIEFLSYEGAFVAGDGPAAGATATDVGVDEDPAPPSGQSLQRARNGVWFGPAAESFGVCNPAEPPLGPTGIVVEGYSFRGSDPLPVGFQELYRVKDVGTGAFLRSGITWTTSDASVARVDALGNVTAVGPGSAVITATEAATQRTASTTVATTVFGFSDLSAYADELQFGTPVDGTPTDEILVDRATFAASWNAALGQPNWVAYNLDASHRAGTVDRCDCFTPDPLLPAGVPVITSADYDGSGYARGHMAMSADRTRGALDNATTFYFTNIVPQTNQNNGGPWLGLETYLGDRAAAGGVEIFVIAGGARHSGTLNGAGRVAIPTRTWKVAVILGRDRGIADVRSPADVEIIAVDIPNTTSIPQVREDWPKYRVTVDSIERLTGYDLLSALPDGIEAAIEATTPGARPVEMNLQPAQLSVSTTAAVNVALLSTATFDAAAVVAAEVRLVTAAGTAVAPSQRNGVVTTTVRDLDGDGRPDRQITFATSALRAAGFGVATPQLVLRPTGVAPAWEARDVAPPTVVP